MALPLRTSDQTERRHDRPHRTTLGERRVAHRSSGTRAHARARCARQPESDRVLPLASPPPRRGRGFFAETGIDAGIDSGADAPHSPTIWREMMSRWMSDVPS